MPYALPPPSAVSPPVVAVSAQPCAVDGMCLLDPERECVNCSCVLRPTSGRIQRPETVRLRSRLDDVMARLNLKLARINNDGEAIASNLDPKATQMARAAFTTRELDLEE